MTIQHLRTGIVLLSLIAVPSIAAAQNGTIPPGPASGTPSDPTIGSNAAPASMSGPGSMQPGTPTKADGSIPGTKVPETGSVGTSGSGNSQN